MAAYDTPNVCNQQNICVVMTTGHKQFDQYERKMAAQRIQLPCEQHLEAVNEEFNNFLHRASEVQRIVQQLASSDEHSQRIGIAAADRILQHTAPPDDFDEDDVALNVRCDRSVLNHHHAPPTDGSTTTQAAFMAEVARDADRRHQERCVRTERMRTFKTRAAAAFRRADYAKALCCYNKAVEQIKDCPLLYNNRALTYMRLALYESAVRDTEMALRLNETCLRAYALQAKAQRCMDDASGYQRTCQLARAKLAPSVFQQFEELINEGE